MVVLQTILILILVYYALKLGLKWLAPRLFNYAVKKSQEQFAERFGQYPRSHNHTSTEDDTTLRKKPRRTSNPSKKVGEYIDFEEIE